MCEMVTVPISAVGRGSPKSFGYRIPRVAELSDGSEENMCHLNNKTNYQLLSTALCLLTVLVLRLHVPTIAPDY
jgi:hypothetical protein